MKTLLALTLLSMLLSACVSSPRPKPYPDGSQEENINASLISPEQAAFPKNRFERGAWSHQFLLNGSSDFQDTEYSTQIWYFAQHAEHIDITGEQSRIAALQNLLLKGGASGTFTLHASCMASAEAYCPDVTTVVFSKGMGRPAAAMKIKFCGLRQD